MKKKIIYSLIIFLTIFTFSNKVFADISNLGTSLYHSDTGNPAGFSQPIGTGLTGSIESVSVYGSMSNSYPEIRWILLDCYTDSNYSIRCDGNPTGSIASNAFSGTTFPMVFTSTPQVHTSDTQISTPYGEDLIGYEFESDKYYKLSVGGVGADGPLTFYGDNSNNFPQATNYNGGAISGGIVNVYFEINTVSTTEITATIPSNLATGVNAFTTFKGTYTNDGTYDTILITYENLDTIGIDNNFYFKVCDIANIGENLNYSCNISLITNTNYAYSASLWDSTKSIAEEGSLLVDINAPIEFQTGTVYEVMKPPTSSKCATFDVGCYIENALGWFFGVDQNTLNQFGELSLRNTFPFSYIYDIENLYDELFNQDPENIDISIDFLEGEITLLSTAKLQAVPFQSTVRTIMGAIMIFMATMFIYRKIINIHDKHEVIDKE